MICRVGAEEAPAWRAQQRFGACLDAACRGPLPYRAADNLPYGVAWNKRANGTAGRSFAAWARTLPGVRRGATIEIPYATAGGAEVNQDTARRFGHDLAAGIDRHLREEGQDA